MTRIENSKVPLTNLAAFLPTDIHKTKNFNGVNREISGRTKWRIIKRVTFLSLSKSQIFINVNSCSIPENITQNLKVKNFLCHPTLHQL